MQIIEIQTLIDITDTKVNRPKYGLVKEHDQYKNFVTMKQCVELRSIITYDTDPRMETKDIKNLGFGTSFKGKHNVWTFRFSPDRHGPYSDEFDEVGLLINDLHEVPVIQKLNESINMNKAFFDLKDAQTKNTIVKAIKGTI